ncbi:DUF2059 domain-containing protein [Roseateles violae]|uniref:DUF2059 domain-containing protein n=1 Tax=Roseateles violae TaxID=3058042 RepID=A0ABT8DPB9_9BURK|nr:DUF2059 domain-containing protein [Pelomonas sp. PFR6]MDN3920201.1 DUF2059 domain-containing protein [Pelomonas sp. PFR6]
MNNKSLKVLAAAALLCAAQFAAAQNVPVAPQPSSPAKKELIAKLMVLQQPGVEQLSRVLLQQPLGPLMQQAGQALQQVPADKREATAKAMEAEIKKFVDDNAPMMRERALKLAPSTVGTLLEERFSEDELRQLVAWLESPVSKKFGQINGELQKALTDKLLADAGPILQPRFQTLQQNLAKQLGLPPAPNASSTPAPSAKPATPPKK